MKHSLLIAALVTPALLLAACKRSEDAAPKDAATSTEAPNETATAAPTAATATDGFDISKIPVSTAPVGEFPFFTLPAGYTSQGYGETKKDFARFPFWVGGAAHWVEGKFYGTAMEPVKGKSMSQFEVIKNFEDAIKKLGGVKVGEGKIPIDTAKGWGEEITLGFINGLGDVYNEPVTTWVIRRADGNIWVHLVVSSAGASYLIGQEKPFEASMTLLPASDLKKAIDTSGKVSLHVNFATDKTDILPDSLPQIDQVAALLTDDPALKLAINGHTDNSGDKARNQTLSEGRAKAVVAALVAKGIAATRLSAKGFGDSQPVADNGSEDGKAKNRRVDLVKA